MTPGWKMEKRGFCVEHNVLYTTFSFPTSVQFLLVRMRYITHIAYVITLSAL